MLVLGRGIGETIEAIEPDGARRVIRIASITADRAVNLALSCDGSAVGVELAAGDAWCVTGCTAPLLLIKVLEVRRETVRLGIQAPRTVTLVRGELPVHEQ